MVEKLALTAYLVGAISLLFLIILTATYVIYRRRRKRRIIPRVNLTDISEIGETLRALVSQNLVVQSWINGQSGRVRNVIGSVIPLLQRTDRTDSRSSGSRAQENTNSDEADGAERAESEGTAKGTRSSTFPRPRGRVPSISIDFTNEAGEAPSEQTEQSDRCEREQNRAEQNRLCSVAAKLLAPPEAGGPTHF